MIQIYFNEDAIVEAIHALTLYTKQQIRPLVWETMQESILFYIKENIRSRLHKNATGALERSFYYDPETHTIISRAPYARIQDKGGIITPKRGKYLAMPLDDHMRGISPRNSGRKLFFVQSRKGNKLLVERKNRGIKPVYLLKPKVVIRPTNYLRDAIFEGRRHAQTFLARELAARKYKI